MPKYIDADYADKLAKDLFKGQIGITFYQAVHALLESVPSIDVVPVQCKDCKFLGVKDFATGYCKGKMCGIVMPDDFCSHGIRRDEEQ